MMFKFYKPSECRKIQAIRFDETKIGREIVTTPLRMHMSVSNGLQVALHMYKKNSNVKVSSF